jgi:hypothetical protein
MREPSFFLVPFLGALSGSFIPLLACSHSSNVHSLLLKLALVSFEIAPLRRAFEWHDSLPAIEMRT